MLTRGKKRKREKIYTIVNGPTSAHAQSITWTRESKQWSLFINWRYQWDRLQLRTFSRPRPHRCQEWVLYRFNPEWNNGPLLVYQTKVNPFRGIKMDLDFRIRAQNNKSWTVYYLCIRFMNQFGWMSIVWDSDKTNVKVTGPTDFRIRRTALTYIAAGFLLLKWRRRKRITALQKSLCSRLIPDLTEIITSYIK
jgi:hypothetical protein